MLQGSNVFQAFKKGNCQRDTEEVEAEAEPL